MSEFDDHVMAVDAAREAKDKRLENPQPGFWNKYKEALRNASIKCKQIVCGGTRMSNNDGNDGDCEFTEND
jgi:hypothetical protein